MPEYTFCTEETVPHIHKLDIELPVDMGQSAKRLTDRMAKTVAENKAIDGIAEVEKVVAVYDDHGTQIWPRERKDRKAKLPEVHPEQTAPPETEEEV